MCTSGNNKNNCYIVHGHKSTYDYKILEGAVHLFCNLFWYVLDPLRPDMWKYEWRAYLELQNKLVFYLIFLSMHLTVQKLKTSHDLFCLHSVKLCTEDLCFIFHTHTHTEELTCFLEFVSIEFRLQRRLENIDVCVRMLFETQSYFEIQTHIACNKQGNQFLHSWEK